MATAYNNELCFGQLYYFVSLEKKNKNFLSIFRYLIRSQLRFLIPVYFICQSEEITRLSFIKIHYRFIEIFYIRNS